MQSTHAEGSHRAGRRGGRRAAPRREAHHPVRVRQPRPAPEPTAPPGLRRFLKIVPSSASPLAALQLAVPWLAMVDPARLGAADAAERTRGRRMIFHLAALSGAAIAPERVEAALSAGTVA